MGSDDTSTLRWLLITNENGCTLIEGPLHCDVERLDTDPPELKWEVTIPYDHPVDQGTVESLVPLRVEDMIVVARQADGGILHGIGVVEDHLDSGVVLQISDQHTRDLQSLLET